MGAYAGRQIEDPIEPIGLLVSRVLVLVTFLPLPLPLPLRPWNTEFRSGQCWETWDSAQRGLIQLIRLELEVGAQHTCTAATRTRPRAYV